MRAGDVAAAEEERVLLFEAFERDGRYFLFCPGDGSEEEITKAEYEFIARPGGAESFERFLSEEYIPRESRNLPRVPVRVPRTAARAPRRRNIRTRRAKARAPDDGDPSPEPEPPLARPLTGGRV
jgi:hypothetical protein